MTGIQEKLAAIFQGEHAEHLEQIRSILALLENVGDTTGGTAIDEAFRRAHSLKGAARAVDLAAVEGLASGLETLFSRVREGIMPLDRQAMRVILGALDASEECVAAFRENRAPDEPTWALRAIAGLLGSDLPAIDDAPRETMELRELRASGPAMDAASRVAGMVRLPAEDLDRLVRSTGQIIAESLRQARVSGQLDSLDAEIVEMAAECERFRRSSGVVLQRIARRPDYSPVIRHVQVIENTVRSLAARSKAARLLQQRSAWISERSAAQLQRDLWTARMAPAEDLFEGFRKMVRDLARQENKEIDFRQTSSGVRADRMVLQSLKDPVMHLLRNAISHGIEAASERARSGKSTVASLIVRLDSQRECLIVEVEDDGRGIDLKKVDEVLSRTEPGVHSEGELAKAIFRPGFSTAPTVGDLSGRGMGLSVVYETVRRLQGDVSLKPKEGPGTSFLLSVPLSVSARHLLLLSCGGQTFGIPTHAIERLHRIPLDRVQTLEGKPVVKLDGMVVPLYGLAHLLNIGDGLAATPGSMLQVMVLKSGAGHFALWVDRFLAERDAMIQELGMPIPATGNISGGAFLRDGTVFVVLNPAGLVAACARPVATPVPRTSPATVKTIAPGILVVDDSVTSRSLEKSILEANGYRVRVAVDGLQALEFLRTEKADLIITDIQMPRLDGFGLLKALKADSQLDRIPVIIVSSLEQPEDRERGLLLGADAYVTKRTFDQTELLETIRQII